MENQRQRAVLLVYGEKTEGLTILVPKSKKKEIKGKFYDILEGYKNPTTVMVNCFDKITEKNAVAVLDSNSDKGYTFVDTIPLGSLMIDVIGHKVHKHYSEEIYYCKLPFEKTFKVVVLTSEKDVKTFIRKELIK